MPQINCPHCGRPQDFTPEQWAQFQGQSITCPGCQQAYTVGAAPGSYVAPAAAVPPPPPAGPYPAYPGQPGFPPPGYPQGYGAPYPPPARKGMGPLAIILIVAAVLAVPLLIS